MFRIYSSSAGSGKTYTLTKEYLKLALQPGPRAGTGTDPADTYFRHILAITFTNAAANEMKSRILSRLEGIAAGQESPMLADIVEELTGQRPGTDAFLIATADLRSRARAVFGSILHNYSDFAVTTIDSFTQRVVMAFTDELGLPYSFEVEMDTDAVLAVAVDNLIEKAGADEGDMAQITDILSQYYRQTAAEGKSWNEIPKLLRTFGKNLTSDQLYQAVAAVQELTPGAIRAIREQLIAYTDNVDSQVLDAGNRAWAQIAGAGLSEDDFKGKKNSVAAFFRTIIEKDHRKEPSATHQKQIDTSEWYLASAKPGTKTVIDGLAGALTDCFTTILSVRETHGRQAALFAKILPNLQKLALLKQLRIEFDDLLRKDGRVHISEFNKKILHIVASEPVPFLYERLGTKYFHILVDEFQDTSRLQFANLMPLIENSLAGRHLNLVVGDGKQAIYRFRGGDMDQIVALHSGNLGALQTMHGPDSYTAERIGTLAGKLTAGRLATNYRSAKPIVAFNNGFFEFVARRFEFQHPKIADVFDPGLAFQQQPAPHARPDAHIQIDFVEKPASPLKPGAGDSRSPGPGENNEPAGEDASDSPDSPDLTAVMLARTLACIRAALAEGYHYGDMAILCRKTAQAKALANELNAQGIPLVSADSLSLQYAESVRLLTTFMALLLRPDQQLLRYELLYLYCRTVHGQTPDDALTANLRAVAERPDIAGVFGYLARNGHAFDPDALRQLNAYELTEKLTHGFGLYSRADDAPFLFRFLDEVLTFSHKQSGHLADFLLYWATASEKVSVDQAPSADAVTITTIHRAKGLEYPVVIMPFVNWNVEPMGDLWLDLESVESDLLDHRLLTGDTVRLRYAPVALGKALDGLPDGLREQYVEEVTRCFLENLNLLYVAFTRPTDRLYVLAEAMTWSSGRAQKTVSYWLHEYLESPHARNCGYIWSDDGLSCRIQDCAQAFGGHELLVSDDEIWLDTVPGGHRGQHLQLRRQAAVVFDIETFARTRDHDRKLILALSLLRGAGDIDPVLRQLVGQGLVRRSDYADLRADLHTITQHPDLADYFDPGLRIDTDRTILSRAQLHGAPHRVVHRTDGSLVLVQYQTGGDERQKREEGDEDEGLVDAGALPFFLRLYRDMGYPAVEGRLVLLGNPLRVVSVKSEA